MSNPFNDVLDRTFRGQYVCVSGDGAEYEGYVDRIHHNRGSIVLHNANRITQPSAGMPHESTKVGSVFIRTVDEMYIPDRQKRVEYVSISKLEPYPEYDHEFEPADTHMRSAARNGFTGSFPVVRPMGSVRDDSRHYQILNGHKRIEACARVGLEAHSVEVIRCTDEQAEELFRLAHRSYSAEETSGAAAETDTAGEDTAAETDTNTDDDT